MPSHPTTRSCFLPAAIFLATGAARPVHSQTVNFQELYVFNGDGAYDFFGGSVSGAGDVNGDGFDDVIVGGDLNESGSNSGKARVFSGVDGSVLHTFNGMGASNNFGHIVAGAGDVNGDGFDDLIVGAPRENSDNGSVRVFSGLNGEILYNLIGNDNDYLGRAVSDLGDINGDGFDDFIVGAPFAEGFRGKAIVYSGAEGSVLFTIRGEGFPDFTGEPVSGIGDVNGDGINDFVIGSSNRVVVHSGVDGSVHLDVQGDSTSDRFGGSVSGAGDVNADGYDDFIVGATGDDNNGNNSGSARVFSGIDGSVLFTVNGDDSNDYFGHSVSDAGDVNGDGFDDFVVGAREDEVNGQGSGSARIFSGADGSVLATFNGDSLLDRLGISVSGAGDVNGDGYSDLVIGVYGDDLNGPNSGNARVIVVVPRLCAEQNGDGQLTTADFSAWIANFNNMSLFADVNKDGHVTPADLSAWFAAFNHGASGPTCVP